jgi:hypothetical protein
MVAIGVMERLIRVYWPVQGSRPGDGIPAFLPE